MSRQSQPTSTHFLFTVAKQPTFLASGERAGFANVRLDTGKVIGDGISKTYGLVQNEDAVNAVEDAFNAYGLSEFKRSAIVLRGGAGLAMTYDFPNRQITVPRVNDILGLRLTLKNSFDGTAPLAFELGFLRLICLNGMKSMVRELALTKKHSGTVDLAFIRARLAEAVTKAQDAAQLYALMAEIALSQIEGENLLFNLALEGTISNKVALGVLEIWRKPSYRQDEARNLYNLYNAFTQHMTRNVEPDAFEMARRVSGTVTATFARVATNRNDLTPLLMAPPQK